jgi:hypothetical protein
VAAEEGELVWLFHFLLELFGCDCFLVKERDDGEADR